MIIHPMFILLGLSIRLLEFSASRKTPKLHCEEAILEAIRSHPVSLSWSLVQLLRPLHSELEVCQSHAKHKPQRAILAHECVC